MTNPHMFTDREMLAVLDALDDNAARTALVLVALHNQRAVTQVIADVMRMEANMARTLAVLEGA